ncbi:MAG: DNA-binding transcriptional regulator CytR [Pirellulaceae bacterium]|nr:MAG: DNA-binding transcriptional regulator CytR [Pirellulaceae bacterium]
MRSSEQRRPRRSKSSTFKRITRPPSMVAQVEQALRRAIAENYFPNGKLPTEVELAEQLGVSRETVRLAAEALQREGLILKIRHRGTFIQPPTLGRLKRVQQKLVGYVQTDFVDAQGHEEFANREISGRMLQGALDEASKAGFQLLVRRTTTREWRETVRAFCDAGHVRGIMCVSYQEEKMLRRLAGCDSPIVLLDEDANVPGIHSVRDDSLQGAREAIRYLAQLGHRRIAYAHWARTERNPSRPLGYRQGMRDAGLYRRPKWEIPTELTEVGTRRMVDELLALQPCPTALYCFNNTLAKMAIDELRRRAVRVPEDLSVMGAGGEEVLGLTCHQADWYQMGRAAMQVLLRALAEQGQSATQHLRLPHILCVGHTTAAPASKATK